MANHQHHHCQHDVQWCRDCQTVYCTRCDATWEAPCTRLHYPIVWHGSGSSIRTDNPAPWLPQTFCHASAVDQPVQTDAALATLAHPHEVRSALCTHGEH